MRFGTWHIDALALLAAVALVGAFAALAGCSAVVTGPEGKPLIGVQARREAPAQSNLSLSSAPLPPLHQ